MQLDINANIMDINNTYADKNRSLLASKRILTLNIMGSPGAGKTTLLERLLAILQPKLQVAVIEGDLATARDADRIAALGADVIQINTDGACHLDAKMISLVLGGFDLEQLDLLIIENVGNLVCPAGFDLGEDLRLVVMSVAEGSDKPAKYPGAFLAADWLLLTKMDLLEYLDFDLEGALTDVKNIKPTIKIFPTFCSKKGVSGLDAVADALMELVCAKKEQ